jgi:hypothetical protein
MFPPEIRACPRELRAEGKDHVLLVPALEDWGAVADGAFRTVNREGHDAANSHDRRTEFILWPKREFQKLATQAQRRMEDG